MEIGKQIKELRKNKNITQKELAKTLEKSERIIQKYESGETIPPLPVVNKIADALGVSLNELLGNDEQTIIELGKNTTDEEDKKTLRIAYMDLKHKKYTEDYIKELQTFYEMLYQLTHESLAPITEIEHMIFNIGLDNFKSVLPNDKLMKLNKILYFLISLDAPLGITMDDIKTFLNELKEGE